MAVKEICVEKVANGYIIEAEQEEQASAMKSMPYRERKTQYIAVTKKEAMKHIESLIDSLKAGGDED